VRYRVVDARDLIPSHTADAFVLRRYHTDLGAQQQTIQGAQQLDSVALYYRVSSSVPRLRDHVPPAGQPPHPARRESARDRSGARAWRLPP
jgi:hypothetical protein